MECFSYVYQDAQGWFGAHPTGIRHEGQADPDEKVADEELEKYAARYPELTIKQPPYTMIEFDDSVADDANVSNLDNKTGYKFGNTYKMSGHANAIAT